MQPTVVVDCGALMACMSVVLATRSSISSMHYHGGSYEGFGVLCVTGQIALLRLSHGDAMWHVTT